MKKFVILSIGAALGISGFIGSSFLSTTFGMSDVELANIEALVAIELPGVVITCSGGDEGQCFAPDLSSIKMCGEHMYNPCFYVGAQESSCTEPC